ncbi:hypothetical protein ACFQ9X_19125 [Catenulispora yoronensis]
MAAKPLSGVVAGLVPERGPRRVLALATALAMTGYGIYLTASVLYFTRAMGLAPSRVGVGLTVAGAVALAAGVPVGHLADRRGSRGSTRSRWRRRRPR